MLYFEKSQPAPDCLAQEKIKKSGDYKCGDVLDRLKSDFKNKCYICERSKPQSINVEHFRPHRGDRDLKFDWNNLFWACSHCNNTKLDKFDAIINCTDLNENIEARLKYEFKPFPGERVKIVASDLEISTTSTKKMIEAVFNGTTKLKQIESSNLRDALLQEMRDFQNYLCDYFEDTCRPSDRDFYQKQIGKHLHSASSFTSFKRWVIRSNAKLMKEFGQYLDT